MSTPLEPYKSAATCIAALARMGWVCVRLDNEPTNLKFVCAPAAHVRLAGSDEELSRLVSTLQTAPKGRS
jgi:hypothetical protein